MIYLVSNQHTPPPGIQLASRGQVFDFCKGKSVLAMDTETEGEFDFESRLLTFQVGDSIDQYVVDCQYMDWKDFKDILEDKEVTKVFQNANYDNKFFRQSGILMRRVYDTFLAELVLNCGLKLSGFSLDVLTSKYTNLQMSKETRGKIKRDGLSKEVIEYAAKDVEVLPEIMEKQWKIAGEYKLRNVIRLENLSVLGFSEMEYNGIQADPEYIEQVAKEDLIELERQKEYLDQIVTKEKKLSYFVSKQIQTDLFREPRKVTINYNSPLQVKKAIDDLGIKVSGTSKDALKKVKDKHKFVSSLMNYRSQQKLTSNYGRNLLNFINPNTGRVHTSFWQVLNTGRVSSGNKDKNRKESEKKRLGKWRMEAPNMQNLPSSNRYRNMFVASKGHKLVMSDYGSQELALIADDSQDQVWLDTISRGEDLHSVVAEKVFGDDWTNATEEGCEFASERQKCSCKGHKDMRTKIKTINYALSYGAGPEKIADQLNISTNEAGQIVQMYFNTFYTLRDYFDSIKRMGKSNLRIRTFKPFSRARFFQEPSSYSELGAIERESTNTRIQGTGADIIKLAVCYLFDYIHENNYPAQLVLQVHDELITQVREDKTNEWVEIKEQLMRKASDKVTGVPIDVESKISDKWEK